MTRCLKQVQGRSNAQTLFGVRIAIPANGVLIFGRKPR